MQRSLSSTRALSVASDDAGETTRELPRVHPATRAKRWTIKLKRKGDRFGARMKKTYGYKDALVMGVKSIDPLGMLGKFNSLFPRKAVEVHDVFISVNGVQGDWDRMVAEFASGIVEIIVERPSEYILEAGAQWAVEISKEEGERLGANLFSSRECRNQTALAVLAITKGPLASHNEAHPGSIVEVNDLIIAVNGVAGDSLSMLDELCHEYVSLLVERPSPVEAALWTAPLPKEPLTSPPSVPSTRSQAEEEAGDQVAHRAHIASRPKLS